MTGEGPNERKRAGSLNTAGGQVRQPAPSLKGVKTRGSASHLEEGMRTQEGAGGPEQKNSTPAPPSSLRLSSLSQPMPDMKQVTHLS